MVANVAFAGSLLMGCGSARPAVHAQRADVTVHNEETRGPVQGASIRVNGQAAGATRADGHVELNVSGIAGDKFHVELACPEGYRPPTPDSQDVFVIPSLSGPPPQLVFHCVSSTRKAVVNVRAEKGPNLPVRYLGREVGRTDASGTAWVTIETTPGDSFELVLDTTSAKTLHPQSPALLSRRRQALALRLRSEIHDGQTEGKGPRQGHRRHEHQPAPLIDTEPRGNPMNKIIRTLRKLSRSASPSATSRSRAAGATL